MPFLFKLRFNCTSLRKDKRFAMIFLCQPSCIYYYSHGYYRHWKIERVNNSWLSCGRAFQFCMLRPVEVIAKSTFLLRLSAHRQYGEMAL